MSANIVYFPNKWQKYLAPIMAALAVAPGIIFSTLPIFISSTPRDMNWGLLTALILIACAGLCASWRLYSESRIAIIFEAEGVRIVGAKKKFYTFWAWNDIKQYKVFEDAFKRQYVMLTNGSQHEADENTIIKQCSHVLISDSLVGFRIDSTPSKGVMLEMLENNIVKNHIDKS